ncbi:MAG: DUF4410 domain-containing protein [Candidatus Omnitrophota bacterium]
MKRYGVLAALILVGCAHVHPTGFLSDYTQLQKGQYLEKVFIAPGLKQDRMMLEIKPPTAEGGVFNDALPPKTAQVILEQSLRDKLAGVPHVKVATPNDQPTHALLTAITKLDPGSRAERWFIGSGAGKSVVQIEGKLVDGNGNILLAFADRRAGAAMGDITGGDSRAMMLQDLEAIVDAVRDTLTDVMMS